MTRISGIKLNKGFFHRIFHAPKKLLKFDRSISEPILNLEILRIAANSHVEKFLRLPFKAWICRLFFSVNISQLYIYANYNKNMEIQNKEKREMLPNEYLPLDMCETAIIARKNKLTIVSFNEDYRHFQKFQYKSSMYVQYGHPDDLLRDYTTPRMTMVEIFEKNIPASADKSP